MVRVSMSELQVLLAEARASYNNRPSQARLEGMNREPTEGEALALAYLEAVAMVLNSKGAFKSGWLEANSMQLESPDSDPETEFADWVSEEEPKE